MKQNNVWDTALNTIFQVAGLPDLSAAGQTSKLRQASKLRLRKLLPKPSPYRARAWATATLISHQALWCSRSLATHKRNKFLSHRWWNTCHTLISRLAREMDTQHLALRDVWGTRTPEFQRSNRLNASRSAPRVTRLWKLSTSNRRRRLSRKTLATHLFKHLALIVGYAEAGSMPITPPSGSLPRERRRSDTAQCVPVSFDIVLAYLFQVFAATQKWRTSVARC